jgi:hypothetical protein
VRQLNALSISRSIETALFCRNEPVLQVLAVFDRACTLVTAGGDVVALTFPEIGNGPLNIVVDGTPGDFAAIAADMPIRLETKQLRMRGLVVALDMAAPWNPYPEWDRLRAHHTADPERLGFVQAYALHHAAKDSLLALLRPDTAIPPAGHVTTAQAMLDHALQAARRLSAGWQGSRHELEAGAAQLSGLGGGLTPAGDDFLAGVMLWAWLVHAAPDSFCQWLLDACQPRTVTLSAAILRAAARGECSAQWHQLFLDLQDGSQQRITAAVQGVLAHGHTSGADTLAGFLWIGQQSRPAHNRPRIADFAHKFAHK